MSAPYTHPSGVKSYIKLNPQDSLKGLAPVYHSNPATFTPQINPHTQRIDEWGIVLQGDGHQSMASIMRNMEAQHLYKPIGGTNEKPEVQFVNALIERKKQQLSQNAEASKARSKLDYELKITMIPDLDDSAGEPLIWRKIKVSGGTRLGVFQDKILQPVMGWVRNYHGYLFTDRSDGALFGPARGNHIDMMHLAMNGHAFLSDKQYSIADILIDENASMKYHYDLGDHWRHEITVVKIRTIEESDGKVQIFEGSGACPAEDHHGNFEWREVMYNPRPPSSILRSVNYKGVSIFEPFQFDQPAAENRLIDALGSRASVVSGAKQYAHYTFRGTQPEGGCFEASRNKDIMRKVEDDPEVASSSLMSSVRVGNEQKISAMCAHCGRPGPEGLLRCQACQAAWYCGRECQRAQWPRHKVSCNK